MSRQQSPQFAPWKAWVLVPAVVLGLVLGVPQLAHWLAAYWDAPLIEARESRRDTARPGPSAEPAETPEAPPPEKDGPVGSCYQIDSPPSTLRSVHERREEAQAALSKLGLVRAFQNESVVVWAMDSTREIDHKRWIEATARLVRSITGLPLPRQRLNIIRCVGFSDVGRVTTALRCASFPRHATGAYYRSLDIAFVLDHMTARVTLCHEMVHWIVSRAVPDCPPALEEGLALYLSEAVIAPRLQQTVERASQQLKSRDVSVRFSSALRREGRLWQLAREQNRFDIFALCHAEPALVYGPGAECSTRRDLAFCAALVLCEQSEQTGVAVQTLLSQIQRANHAGDALVTAFKTPRFESAWVAAIKTYRTPRFTVQR